MNTLMIKVLAAVALVIGLGLFEQHRIGVAEQRGFDRATSERAARDAVAVATRLDANKVEMVKNTDINRFITKAKNEELAPVVRTIYVDRVRVGPASCGPASTSQAEDAGSGNSADSPGRLVREDVERDTRALTEAVELDLATGRACQAWGHEHGFIE